MAVIAVCIPDMASAFSSTDCAEAGITTDINMTLISSNNCIIILELIFSNSLNMEIHLTSA
jgi:hypothetical protein